MMFSDVFLRDVLVLEQTFLVPISTWLTHLVASVLHVFHQAGGKSGKSGEEGKF